jgi:GntR family transcriptional regulator/MocR family aminotransferase
MHTRNPRFFKLGVTCGILKAPLFMQSQIPLSKKGGPLFRQIYLRLREEILSGVYRSGEKLPSTRDVAEQLKVSRTIVLLAYDQLLAEGFAVGRAGSGTFVSGHLIRSEPRKTNKTLKLPLSRFGSAAVAAAASVSFPNRPKPPSRYDFAYGRTDVTIFPFEAWRRILLHHARMAPVREFEYGQAAGSPALREAICAHLRRSRAVVCDPTEVIVVSGSQQALDLVARVLVERGDRVAIEDPQYLGAREVLLAAGATLRPVPVDRDGLNPAKLPQDVSLVFVTPSHQFPTGAILPLGRRLALLEWATRMNLIIVENDNAGEFHSEGRPLESLQGLDTDGRIIYIGTFSRTIFPSLRIGYLIVPKSLVSSFTSAKWLCDQHTATLEQETLAEFLTNGMYERHLRRLRRKNTERRGKLLSAIRTYLGDRVEVTGDHSGTHIVLWPRKRVSEAGIIAEAAKHGVGIYGISPYFLKRPSRTGLMLGYSRMNEAEIVEGVRRLRKII